MIFLIAKIFVYLLVSLALGAVAGWLWRNRDAQNRENELDRALLDARSRLPQMETALRGRDQRFEALRVEYNAREEELARQNERLAERDRQLAELDRACAELRARLEAGAPAEAARAPDPGAARAGVDDELALHPGHPADVTAAPHQAEDSDAPSVSEAVAEARASALAEATEAAAEQRRELELALADSRRELEGLQRALTAERRRVEELTQERELQRRSLAALEQQLEMAREDDRNAAQG